MLASAAGIEHVLDGLEVRYLANRDPCLHFALLTDFVDAAAETLPGDAELVRLVREGVERLNEKYADVRGDIFYLFHRSRRWNAQEGVWMGYERKRGKLADLNAMLRGATGRFAEVVGDAAILQSVRYVITLDTDTQLPRDAARLMVGTLAHRLNRPVFDAHKPPRRRWLHDFAAASRRQPAQCPAIALRATVFRGSGRRSVHARRLGCVPGSVWRRVVHRQGDLRRRFLRAVLRRLSRKRDSQP